METLTQEQFNKKYGVISSMQFDDNKRESNLFSEIKNAFQQGVGRIGQGIQEAKPAGGTGNPISGVGKILGGAAEAITSPAAPILDRTVGAAFNAVGNQIGNIPAVQKFAMSPAGQTTSKVAETVRDYANAAGLIAGGPKIGRGIAKVSEAVPKVGGAFEAPNFSAVASEASGAVGNYVKSAVRDVIPTRQNWIDSNLAKALDLTPGDLTNIARSTGNEIGPWLSEHNLIGSNKANTVGLIKNFFTENYNAVRSEIAKVKDVYTPDQVPRLKETLQQLGAEVQGKIGLEDVSKEITKLAKKEEITLSDVQRVKELLDEHYSLYKATGDVQAGVTKQGLANVREDLKTFIEKEVQRATGADIRALNKNVSTARSLESAIEARSQRGLTRTHFTQRDIMLGLGLYAFVNPVVGIGAVFIRKLTESPTVRLRVARYLDSISDKEKAQINASLQEGKVPPVLLKEAQVTNAN